MTHDKFCLAGRFQEDVYSYRAVMEAHSRPVVESVCICHALTLARADEREQAAQRVWALLNAVTPTPWREAVIAAIDASVDAARGEDDK